MSRFSTFIQRLMEYFKGNPKETDENKKFIYEFHDVRDKDNGKQRKLSILKNLCKYSQEWKVNRRERRKSVEWGPARFLAPAYYDEKMLTHKCMNEIKDVSKSQPHTIIFFTWNKSTPNHLDEMILDVTAMHGVALPDVTIIAGCDVSMMDYEEVIQRGPPGNDQVCGVLGLTIPFCEDMEVRNVFSCRSPGTLIDLEAQRIVDQLMPKADFWNSSNTAFIFFDICECRALTREVLEILKWRMKNRPYTVWGYSSSSALLGTNNGKKSWNYIETYLDCFLGLSISGNNFESHSVFINCLASEYEMKCEVAKFRRSVQLKRHKVGLVSGPKSLFEPALDKYDLHGQRDMDANLFAHECSFFMSITKSAFPDVPFIGAFQTGGEVFFGRNSSQDYTYQNMMSKTYLSIVILTYH